MSLLRFVTWGRGGLNLCNVTKKNVNVPKDMRKKNERNDRFSRKIEGIRAMHFFQVLLLVSLNAINLVDGNC